MHILINFLRQFALVSLLNLPVISSFSYLGERLVNYTP